MPQPLDVIQEEIVIPQNEARTIKGFGEIARWVSRAGFRLNSLWTGDSQIIITDGTGNKTVTLKKRYPREPLVLLGVKVGAFGADPPIATYTLTLTGSLYTAVNVKTVLRSTGADAPTITLSLLVIAQ